MTAEEKLQQILQELGELIHSKNQQISYLQYEIKHLKEQLDEQRERETIENE